MAVAKIIWIDDEIESLQSQKFFLENKGYEVQTFTNGFDAIDFVRDNLVDVVLIDESMPGITGLETLAKIKEINQSLQQLGSPAASLHFVPWRGDFTRGIFISSTVTCTWRLEELIGLYEDFYKDHPFVFLSQQEIFLKQVVNTNKCVIQLEKVGSKLVIHSAIDNLLKGASGQAVQNMNLMFGLEERAGLHLKATAF